MVDYIHLQNIIVRAIEEVDRDAGTGVQAIQEYQKLITFLEEMYCNTIVSLGTALLQEANHLEPDQKAELIGHARNLLDSAPSSVFTRINRKYQTVAAALGIDEPHKEN